MSNPTVIRAWKDARYRRSLSAAELEQLPQNPAGPIELTDSELRIAGGFRGGSARNIEIASLTGAACCPTGTTASSCTATFGGCCPPEFQ